MKRWMTLALVGLLVGLVSLVFSILNPPAEALFQQDPTAGSGSCTNYKCDWCCQTHCGCPDPGSSYHFTGWCGCSSIECNRHCDWEPSGS